MENPIQQLDGVLKVLKQDRGHISFDDLHSRVNKKFELDADVLLRIIEKLVRDRYVYEKQKHTGGVDYAITVEGFLFDGYEQQISIEKDLACRKNIRDFVLSYGTALAGLAGLGLLAYSIYSYIYPVASK